MFTLIGRNKKYVAWKSNGMYVVDNLAVIKSLKEGPIKLGLEHYVAIKSNLHDYMSTISRKAQIVSLKDAAYIISRCGIRSGSRVVEGGFGSGSLTTALLYYTYPDGDVYTYDLRQDYIDFAVNNINRLEHGHWEIKRGDVRKDVKERDLDAFVVDIPDPWNAVAMAKISLSLGGCFSAYIPTFNQMEKVYKELERMGFVELEACEIMLRGMHVGALGSRPDNVEMPHTGYLVFGRRV